MKDKKCRVCKVMFQPMNSLQVVCDYKCAIAYTQIKQDKQINRDKVIARKKRIKRKKDFYENDRSHQLKLAQRVFNKFIRLRDKDLPCISCQKFHTGRYDAGHYLAIGSHPELRFNEDNCHKQCHWNCNINQSGNIKNYRINLIKKIGKDRVEKLEFHTKTEKLTIEQIRDIKKKYKDKCKGFNR